MINFCKYQWDKNKGLLEEALKTTKGLNSCSYMDIVKLVVTHIFNSGVESPSGHYDQDYWDGESITEVDNGDYQGTLLFLIPKVTYQPSEDEYLMTYVGYGSCSGCDTLQAIQSFNYGDDFLTDDQIKDFMSLCKDIVTNTIKPYNYGWRENIIYNKCTVDDPTKEGEENEG